MAQPKPRKASLDQVLSLVEQLSSEDRESLRLKLSTKSWGERWDALVKKVREQSKGLPPLSEEEIVAEMKAIRREVWAERAQDNS